MDAVRIELPVPFPLQTVNAWLIPGEAPALIDCGIGSDAVYQELVAAIRAHDVDPGDLRLFATHGHVDHAGNAGRLRRDHGVPLICPRAESPFIETFRRDAGPRNDAFAAALQAHGMGGDDVRRIRDQSDDIDAHLDDTPIVDDLVDGTRLPMGDQDVRAIITPGHTPGSTSFILDDQAAMITGDTLLEFITSNAVELKDDDRGAFHRYVQTVDAMRQYVGLDALPGHHAPFRITDEVIDRHMTRHENRRARILSLLDRPKTAWQVFPEIFPGLNGDDHYFMGMAEIVGHLHSLEIDGLIACRESVERGRSVRRFVAA